MLWQLEFKWYRIMVQECVPQQSNSTLNCTKILHLQSQIMILTFLNFSHIMIMISIRNMTCWARILLFPTWHQQRITFYQNQQCRSNCFMWHSGSDSDLRDDQFVSFHFQWLFINCWSKTIQWRCRTDVIYALKLNTRPKCILWKVIIFNYMKW